LDNKIYEYDMKIEKRRKNFEKKEDKREIKAMLKFIK
jgi:hypothetical protein